LYGNLPYQELIQTVRDEMGATVLHYATLSGLREIVHLVLHRGPEINSLNSQIGTDPSDWAIKYLRERGS
jgi:ankyrin repeat protein